MRILSIVVLCCALILLVVIAAGVPVNQKAVNIILLILVALAVIGNVGLF